MRKERRVLDVDSGRTHPLPSDTPCVSKPWDMAPDAAGARCVGRGERGPVLEYETPFGERRRLETIAMPLEQRNGGDAVLVPDRMGEAWRLVLVRP